jgi:hypothetical protein
MECFAPFSVIIGEAFFLNALIMHVALWPEWRSLRSKENGRIIKIACGPEARLIPFWIVCIKF